MTEIIIKSDNKKAIKAIKTLAEELEMEVSESLKTSKIKKGKRSWDELIKAGIVEPADKSAKISDLAGIWTGRNITLKEIRDKAWNRKHK